MATSPGAAGIDSDDFASGTLESMWTFVDTSNGVCSYAFEGTTDRYISISVPIYTASTPDQDYDFWVNGSPAGPRSARIQQPCDDAAFEITVKFVDPIPSTGEGQSRGLFVKGTAGNNTVATYLRYDQSWTGAARTLYVAELHTGDPPATGASKPISSGGNNYTGTASPFWLRLTRTAVTVGTGIATWTASWSIDGSDFTGGTNGSMYRTWTCNGSGGDTNGRYLTPTQVGIFCGNADGAGAPAYTAKADWFFESSAVISPEDDVALVSRRVFVIT